MVLQDWNVCFVLIGEFSVRSVCHAASFAIIPDKKFVVCDRPRAFSASPTALIPYM